MRDTTGATAPNLTLLESSLHTDLKSSLIRNTPMNCFWDNWGQIVNGWDATNLERSLGYCPRMQKDTRELTANQIFFAPQCIYPSQRSITSILTLLWLSQRVQHCSWCRIVIMIRNITTTPLPDDYRTSAFITPFHACSRPLRLMHPTGQLQQQVQRPGARSLMSHNWRICNKAYTPADHSTQRLVRSTRCLKKTCH